jgi:hypothetical protein
MSVFAVLYLWARVTHTSHKDLHPAIPAQADARFTNLKETRTTRPENAQTTADRQAHFGKPPNPTRFSGDLGHVRPFTGFQHFQR